jgi:hypothetical protein
VSASSDLPRAKSSCARRPREVLKPDHVEVATVDQRLREVARLSNRQLQRPYVLERDGAGFQEEPTSPFAGQRRDGQGDLELHRGGQGAPRPPRIDISDQRHHALLSWLRSPRELGARQAEQ